jgi:hypothetical protein
LTKNLQRGGKNMNMYGGILLQIEGVVNAKALWWESDWHV